MAQPRRSSDHPPIGDRLRATRQERGLSLRELAERLGVSPSLISQVETGRARPSVSTLYAIANELNVSLDELLFPDADPSRGRTLARVPAVARGTMPRDPVQRAGTRKAIRLGSGVVWERLTSESLADAEFLHVTYEVGGASCPEHEFQRHNGQEWGYVLSGRLGVTIGFDDHQLQAGDAIAFESSIPHRLYNAGGDPVQGIWFVLGRNSGGAAPEH
jgi:transcriptional regulator with XRE-family HTH domain